MSRRSFLIIASLAVVTIICGIFAAAGAPDVAYSVNGAAGLIALLFQGAPR